MARASTPVTTGFAERDGVSIAYEVHGTGSTTVVLMPTWSIVHSRFWKAQVAYLSRHFRVVTFDGRGSGRSSRPPGAAAYSNLEYAADTIAVLDAAGVDEAVLVAFSCGASWALHVAADHPERVLGLFAIAPACTFPVAQPDRERFAWDARHDTSEGWAKYNKHYWLDGGYADYLSFFFAKMFTEPHSTKQIEDAIGWASEITPQTLVDVTAGRLGHDGATCEPLEPVCAKVRCPVLVVHGTDDEVRPSGIGERLAELTGGSLVRVEGGGHGIPARDPVVLNRLVKRFVDTVRPVASERTWVRAQRRPKRALYISSPIGLGHALRDAAIADELRKLHPDVHVDWLAQHPVTKVLAERGESVHPASAYLASESGHFEEEAVEHDLHAFQAVRRMDEILVHNFLIFQEVVEEQHYDLVVADEAWDVDHFLHENPELKRSAYAWLTDFVGWLPMPAGGDREAALTADYNAEMLEQRARFRRLRDLSIFVGDPDDVVPDTFGPGLPGIREWTEANFDFPGYVTGFEPVVEAGREALRTRLGYHADRRVCVVTVGGSGVGTALLRRVLDAVPVVRREVPDLHFLVVTGPRIDPASLPRRRGVTYRGYLPNLYEHLAACDVAVVQGGLSTCMELTASGRPFVYIPLKNHFEQNHHVRYRLDRHGAGHHLAYDDATDPDILAAAIREELTRQPRYRPVPAAGAATTASLLADLL